MTWCSIKSWCDFQIQPERMTTNLRQTSSAECRKMERAGWEARAGMACTRCASQFQIGQPPKKISDRKSTRLNSSHEWISYAVFCLKKKKPECIGLPQSWAHLKSHALK